MRIGSIRWRWPISLRPELSTGGVPFDVEEIKSSTEDEMAKEKILTLEGLSREVPVVTQGPASDMMQLAVKAKDLLGYSVLLEETCKPLLEVLAKLEIAVIDKEEVHQYQKQLARAIEFDSEDEVDWNSTSIERYDEPIPEFVLLKAVAIKEELPSVHFHVHHMDVHPDPFLMVALGREEYYIEVWEEPRFEGRLTKEQKS